MIISDLLGDFRMKECTGSPSGAAAFCYWLRTIASFPRSRFLPTRSFTSLPFSLPLIPSSTVSPSPLSSVSPILTPGCLSFCGYVSRISQDDTKVGSIQGRNEWERSSHQARPGFLLANSALLSFFSTSLCFGCPNSSGFSIPE